MCCGHKGHDGLWSAIKWLISILVALLLLLGARVTKASDWPQWRGPNRDARLPDIVLPRTWLDHELAVRWRIPIGEGYASPVVVADRIFSFSREDNREVIQSHHLATGRPQWRFAYPAPSERKRTDRVYNTGPKSTPIIADGRIYALGVNEVLHCLATDTGRVQWRVDFPRRFKVSPLGYGACSSPMIHGRLLLVPAADSIAAIDRRTGALLWRTATDTFYSSLLAGEFQETSQIVAFTRYRLQGLDPASGRIVWNHNYPSMWGSNVATPLVWRDRIIISSPSRGTRALRVKMDGSRTTVRPAWETKALRAYLSSPVLHGDHIYGVDESGQLVCLSAETGRTAWAEGNFGDFASLLVVGDQLLILSGDGDLTAVAASHTAYEQLGQRQLTDSPAWSQLVIAHGLLLVRDQKQLTCFELPGNQIAN